MQSGIDIIYNLISKLGSEPFVFQRYGCVYMINEAGIGHITPGLNIEARDKDQTTLDNKVKNVLVKSDSLYNVEFSRGEQKIFETIRQNPDSPAFDLNDVFEVNNNIRDLKINDDNIRIIDHSSNYHSHKHGYATDGIDVWVTGAFVMEKKDFFEQIEELHNFKYSELEKMSLDGINNPNEVYRDNMLPDFEILTKDVAISFPRAGALHYNGPSWTEYTAFQELSSFPNRGGLFRYNKVDTNKADYFSLNITFNSANINARNSKELQKESKKWSGTMKKIDDAIKSTSPLIEKYLNGLNKIHNKLCADNIREYAEMFGPTKGEKATST